MLTASPGKVAQIAFGFMVPHTSSNAIVINLIVGAIAESGACEAADLMCDLKAGHLLRASPNDLLKGQLLGSLAGAFVASSSYALFTRSYLPKPGTAVAPVEMPSAHMWFEAAKLCAGKGLPEEAVRVSIIMAVVFATTATAKIGFSEAWWVCLIPDGVSFAMGEYVEPSCRSELPLHTVLARTNQSARNVQCMELDGRVGDWRSRPLVLVQAPRQRGICYYTGREWPDAWRRGSGACFDTLQTGVGLDI